jgi:hypothetical protein
LHRPAGFPKAGSGFSGVALRHAFARFGLRTEADDAIAQAGLEEALQAGDLALQIGGRAVSISSSPRPE